ncbi:sensor histidine kinase [Terrilactibacillus laevilacticus]|uniref:histidine kinase n=1 Tax=Terrilactibacillus laevilacticus TaxID=1380157 RepID=A0ABW5PSR9_9BACI|nr:HAMP domain-containing sensor histidine kinase [Terrilactibacillus laevilacticus]
MRISRIGLKLAAAFMILFIILLMTLGMAIDQLFSHFYYAQMKEDSQELASHFVSMAKNKEATSTTMIQNFAEFSSVKIVWVTENGQVISRSDKSKGQHPFINQKDLNHMFSGQSIDFIYKDTSGHRYYVLGKPVVKNQKSQSALYIVSSMNKIDDSIRTVRKLLLLSALGAFLVALGMTFIMSKVLSHPLLKMQKVTDRMAKGDWNARLNIRQKDEMGMLGQSINNLAQSLQRYRDTRQEFFANISHELRTPITYLEGYSQVLTDNLVENESEKKKYLTIIHQEAIRLQKLVDDLFELSKMEEGKTELTIERLDMKDIILNTLSKVKLKAEQKKINLKTEIHQDIPFILGDSYRMEQILLNLLENAIKYTDQGEIIVQLVSENSSLVLSVSDTGQGIPEEELPYIFDRFYRIEKSRSRDYGGTGLGLSIVKKLVDLQGGSIHVESKLDVGTTFTLTFPQHEELESLESSS